MSGRRKRDIGGIVTVEGVPLAWSVKSEPAWNTSDGDIGLRLTIMKHDETLTRHGERKAWRVAYTGGWRRGFACGLILAAILLASYRTWVVA